jgi:hypothetical protein
MRKIGRLYALAAVAVFGTVLVDGLFHNVAIGAAAGLGCAIAIWFAAKHIEARNA